MLFCKEAFKHIQFVTVAVVWTTPLVPSDWADGDRWQPLQFIGQSAGARLLRLLNGMLCHGASSANSYRAKVQGTQPST